MAVKQTGRRTYKTMQGKNVDMDLLRKRNELTQAVGNAKVNARGDELGPGGKIIKKREEVLADYYRDNPTKVPSRNKADGDAPVEHTHDNGTTHSHADGDKPHSHENEKPAVETTASAQPSTDSAKRAEDILKLIRSRQAK